MKKNVFPLLAILALTSCNSSAPKVDITTSMFVHYDFVRQIIEDKLTQELIIPPAVDIHSFSITPKKMATIASSKLFFYTNEHIEPWTNNLNVPNTKIVNIEEEIETYINLEEPEISQAEHDHSAHFWTSPENNLYEIEVLKNAIISIDEDNSDYYELNASNYSEQIMNESNKLKTFLSTIDNKEIFLVGHNAMSDFASYFDLTITSLVNDIKPDHDVTPNELARLVDAISASDTDYIFIEELANSNFALTIKRELKEQKNRDIEILELHGYHNVTLKEYEEGVTYLDLLKRNIVNIEKALG